MRDPAPTDLSGWRARLAALKALSPDASGDEDSIADAEQQIALIERHLQESAAGRP